MILVHFQANYLPKKKKFRVFVQWQGKQAVELMTIAKFLRFARNKTKPIVIGGITIEFEGGDGEQEIRKYFKDVADAYVQYQYKNN